MCEGAPDITSKSAFSVCIISSHTMSLEISKNEDSDTAYVLEDINKYWTAERGSLTEKAPLSVVCFAIFKVVLISLNSVFNDFVSRW